MKEDNILQKLLHLEAQYNAYKVTKEEAIIKGKALVNEYNKKAKSLALKYKMPPKLIKISRFSFGKG